MTLARLEKCEVCGHDDFSQTIKVRDRYDDKEYSFSECQRCSHTFLNPRPRTGDLLLHYPEGYECFSSVGSDPTLKKWHREQELTKRLRILETAFPTKGILLDVGAGNASFVDAAHESGWSVTGIEPNWRMIDHTRRNNKKTIIEKKFSDFDPAGQTYDVITFWDVFEHLPFPKETLKKAKMMLAEEGVIIFSIPNLDSFDRRLFRSAWIGWDPPRHLHLFSRSSLDFLTRNLGLEISQNICFSGGKGTFLLSLENIRTRLKLGKWLNHAYPILSALLLPYRRISYSLNRGPIMTYVLRKMK